MSAMTEREAMVRALALARTALGRTAPNPAVGAVLLRDGLVLGEGATQPPGGPHAEIEALAAARSAGHDPRGATLVVTLEPCAHHGKTPPCTNAIIAAGIRRVVVGVRDPFREVDGHGLEALRAAGIDVVHGIEAEACARQILGFGRSVTLGLPEVTLKVAVSLDGHLATATGESKWITSDEARADAHRLRASHDAIVVGLGTVLADDPELTVRWDGEPRSPVKVVLDADLQTPPSARLLRTGRTMLIAAEDALETNEGRLPATVIRVPRRGNQVDTAAGFRALAAAGLHRVLVEGGASVHRSVLDAGLADTLVVYVAGLLLPGGRPWVAGPPITALDQAPRHMLEDVTRFGPDVRLTYALGSPR
jgi:diaminohydroxyphosphoribosylaminopyrimidine deaminase/5-amino-6-(5-phosphoribosylamino)uracil reductase